MERLTHRYMDGTAWVSLNLVSKMGEYECVGLPITKLATYEDAEEHGLLIRLPCKVGSNIYLITDDGVDVADCREIRLADEEMYIESNTFCNWISFDKIGKTVFLTEEEAETKLSEMEGAE